MHYSVSLIFISFSTAHMAWWHVCFCFYPVTRLSQTWDLGVLCAVLALVLQWTADMQAGRKSNFNISTVEMHGIENIWLLVVLFKKGCSGAMHY